jgi:hypothetical protein
VKPKLEIDSSSIIILITKKPREKDKPIWRLFALASCATCSKLKNYLLEALLVALIATKTTKTNLNCDSRKVFVDAFFCSNKKTSKNAVFLKLKVTLRHRLLSFAFLLRFMWDCIFYETQIALLWSYLFSALSLRRKIRLQSSTMIWIEVTMMFTEDACCHRWRRREHVVNKEIEHVCRPSKKGERQVPPEHLVNCLRFKFILIGFVFFGRKLLSPPSNVCASLNARVLIEFNSLRASSFTADDKWLPFVSCNLRFWTFTQGFRDFNDFLECVLLLFVEIWGIG